MKGGIDMAEVKENEKIKRENQEMDVREYIELLKGLTEGEKMQVKGIMIGMQMTREQLAVLSA